MKASFARLGDLGEFINGLAFKPEDWEDEGARIIRIQNLTDPAKPYNRTTRVVPDRFLVRPGDLLVSWSASLGVFEWHGPDNAVLNQHIFRVIPQFDKVDKHYLRYALEGALVAMGRHVHGSTMQHVNRGEFLDTKILLPSLSEQRRTAAILGQVDTLRKKRALTIKTLDTLPQAIFDQMFGRTYAAGSKLPEMTLADIVRDDDQINYGVVQPGDECDAGVPLIRVANVVANDFSLRALKRIDAAIESQYKRSRLRGDEVLIACVGSIGAVALATPELANTNIARAVARIPVDCKKADRVYVAEFLKLGRTQQYFRTETRAVAQPTLNIKQLSETRIPIPQIMKQREFAGQVAEIARTRSLFLLHLANLESLFASLQNRAFKGELTAKAAERELAEVG